MPKLKNYAPGKRRNIWLPSRHEEIASQIENFSQFVQIALDQAEAIMAFDIIKKEKGLKNKPPTQEAMDRFNADHPLDPLTQKRLKKWPNTPHSQQSPEPW